MARSHLYRRFAGKSNGEIKPNLWPWFTKFKSRWTYICTAMKNYPGMRMVFNTTLPRPWHTIPTAIRALCSRYRTTYASNYTRAFLTLFNTVKFNGIPCPSVDDTNQVTRIGCRASRDNQSQRNLLESMMNLSKARSPPTDNRIIMRRQILSAFASVYAYFMFVFLKSWDLWTISVCLVIFFFSFLFMLH